MADDSDFVSEQKPAAQWPSQPEKIWPGQQTQTTTSSSSPGVLDVLNTAANVAKAVRPGGF